MDTKIIRQVLDSINDLVGADGPWADKYAAILKEATPDDITNLEEFVSWFPEGEDEEEEEEKEDE